MRSKSWLSQTAAKLAVLPGARAQNLKLTPRGRRFRFTSKEFIAVLGGLMSWAQAATLQPFFGPRRGRF
jgi:hypothetical protein